MIKTYITRVLGQSIWRSIRLKHIIRRSRSVHILKGIRSKHKMIFCRNSLRPLDWNILGETLQGTKFYDIFIHFDTLPWNVIKKETLVSICFRQYWVNKIKLFYAKFLNIFFRNLIKVGSLLKQFINTVCHSKSTYCESRNEIWVLGYLGIFI